MPRLRTICTLRTAEWLVGTALGAAVQGSGKSSLVLRFVKSQFFDYQESTIGAAFLTKTLPDQHVKFEIWCVPLRLRRKCTLHSNHMHSKSHYHV